MTNDEIIAMAKSAGIDMLFAPDHVQSFFNLAYAAGQAHEREECAKVCVDVKRTRVFSGSSIEHLIIGGIEEAIRARGEKR